VPPTLKANSKKLSSRVSRSPNDDDDDDRREMECSICCEKYNKSSRKPVGCGCGIEVCRECAQRVLLDTATNPQCMGCRRPWDSAFLAENFTKVFISKTLKEHRANVLFDREKAMLPEAQPLAELTKAMKPIVEATRASTEKIAEEEMLYREKCIELDGLRVTMRHENRLITDIGDYITATKAVAELRKSLAAEKAILLSYQDLQKIVRNLMDPTAGPVYSGGEASARRFVRACPAEGCRGFLSEQWKCGLCNVRVCAKCHEIKTAAAADTAADPSAPGPSQPRGGSSAPQHVCNPENVASAAMIAKDSRPCPSCAALIHRVSGCDQMWCVCCKTAFNYRTGVVDKGVIHNPEYNRYLRERAARMAAADGNPEAVAEPPAPPRAEGDVPCGRANIHGERELPATYDRFAVKMHQTLKLNGTPAGNTIMAIYHAFNHNNYAIRRRYGEAVAPEARNRDIRIKFLLGDIDETAFKRLLHQREKAEAKKNEYREAFTTFQNITADYLVLVYTAETKKAAEDLAEEMERLRVFTNDLLGQIAARYNAVPPAITAEFRLESV